MYPTTTGFNLDFNPTMVVGMNSQVDTAAQISLGDLVVMTFDYEIPSNATTNYFNLNVAMTDQNWDGYCHYPVRAQKSGPTMSFYTQSEIVNTSPGTTGSVSMILPVEQNCYNYDPSSMILELDLQINGVWSGPATDIINFTRIEIKKYKENVLHHDFFTNIKAGGKNLLSYLPKQKVVNSDFLLNGIEPYLPENTLALVNEGGYKVKSIRNIQYSYANNTCTLYYYDSNGLEQTLGLPLGTGSYNNCRELAKSIYKNPEIGDITDGQNKYIYIP